jgi:hypothetical protein
MWAQLDAHLQEMKAHIVPPPPGAFLFADFMQRFNFTENQGRKRLETLVRGGKVKEAGMVGNRKFYVMVTK